MKKRTHFIFMREFAKLHYKRGEMTLNEYNSIIGLLDAIDERMTLESEE